MTRPTAAPVLHTDRLTLRAHRLDDFAPFAAMWGDPIVTRHIGGRPSTHGESWARLLRIAGHWALLGFGYWLVEETASGRLVGDVGFGDLQRGLTPSLDGTAEMGWVLSPWAHGRGYAHEAATAALAWAAAHVDRPVTCIIDLDNVPSQRLAARLGFHELARTTFDGDPTIVYRR